MKKKNGPTKRKDTRWESEFQNIFLLACITVAVHDIKACGHLFPSVCGTFLIYIAFLLYSIL